MSVTPRLSALACVLLSLIIAIQAQQISLNQCYSVQNQADCGSCFIFSSTSALSTRMCLAPASASVSATVQSTATTPPQAGSNTFVQLSQEYPLECLDIYITGSSTDGNVCGTGGFPSDVLLALSSPNSDGSLPSQPWFPTASAQPYTSGSCGESSTLAACTTLTCPADNAFYDVNGASESSYTALGVASMTVYSTGTNNGVSIAATVQAIKDEITNNGPVVAAIYMCSWDSFYTYWANGASNTAGGSPTYFTPSACSTTQSGHAIMIVGWTTLGGSEVWVIQNSWGTTINGGPSGDNGYFYLQTGQNVINIESAITTALLPWQTLTSGSASAWTQVQQFQTTYAAQTASMPRPGAAVRIDNWQRPGTVEQLAANQAASKFIEHIGNMARSPVASHDLAVYYHATLPRGPLYRISGSVTHTDGTVRSYTGSTQYGGGTYTVLNANAVIAPVPPSMGLAVGVTGYVLAAALAVSTVALAVLLVRTRRAAIAAMSLSAGDAQLKSALL